MGRPAKAAPAEGFTQRQIRIPAGVYTEVKQLNLDIEKQGIKRSTEEELLALISERVRFRKLLTGQIQSVLSPSEKQLLTKILT